MKYLKRIVRVTPRRRKKEQLGASVALRVLGLLPVPQAVEVKEHIRLMGRLDYPRGGILMSLDSSMQLARLRACEKEPETVEWIETRIRPSEVLYDIGANVGAYSFVTYVATEGDCTVYAFEPSFSTFAALSQNVLLNRCQGKIVPLHLALSDKTGLQTFQYSDVTPGAALHSLGEPISEDGSPFHPEFSQPILSYRMDDVVRQFALKLPNHMKIDVDGAELSVLRGADETLAHPALRSILVEVDHTCEISKGIARCLERKGFRLHSRHPRWRPETFNYIFVR